VRRIGSRAVPQYFVMVGGGAAGTEATFARTAAKIPARRLTEAVDRLIALYARERQADESAPDFFARLDLARVRQELVDLERLTSQDSMPADFVDLGEVSEFNPLVMDGECSA
jgi:sulfite reductase (NADPH) hemoprotein beta-component